MRPIDLCWGVLGTRRCAATTRHRLEWHTRIQHTASGKLLAITGFLAIYQLVVARQLRKKFVSIFKENKGYAVGELGPVMWTLVVLLFHRCGVWWSVSTGAAVAAISSASDAWCQSAAVDYELGRRGPGRAQPWLDKSNQVRGIILQPWLASGTWPASRSGVESMLSALWQAIGLRLASWRRSIGFETGLGITSRKSHHKWKLAFGYFQIRKYPVWIPLKSHRPIQWWRSTNLKVE